MAGRCISAQASVSTQRCNRHINKYPLEWPCRNDSGWMSIFRNRAGLFYVNKLVAWQITTVLQAEDIPTYILRYRRPLDIIRLLRPIRYFSHNYLRAKYYDLL